MRKKMDDKQRESNKIMILDCARSIMETEGLEGISIRKVAKSAGYTEGNVYNYFENKDRLITELIQLGYQQMMKSVTAVPYNSGSTEEQILQMFINYTEAALEMPEYYKAVMLSEDPKILKITSVLSSGEEGGSKGIQKLEEMLIKGMETGEFAAEDPSFIARSMWTANFGLTIRLIIENPSKGQDAAALVRDQLGWIFRGLKRREDHGNQ